MSYVRTAVGLVVGILTIHIAQYAAIQIMAPSVPVFLDLTTQGGVFSAHERIKDIRNVVVLWVPLVADAGLIAIAVAYEYRKQKVTAAQQVGPLR
jgi:membrane protein DedA with SNARE-associated domain